MIVILAFWLIKVKCVLAKVLNNLYQTLWNARYWRSQNYVLKQGDIIYARLYLET